MPEPARLEKAELRELDDRGEQTSDKTNWMKVQFNPDTLKLNFSNQVVPPTNNVGNGDQRGNSTIQYVGRGTTKLSITLWFDVTGVQLEGNSDEKAQPVTDVQELTKKVIYYVKPKPDKTDSTKFKPPGIRFVWGTFQFDGIVESIDQTLEFFGPDGKPLRASVALNLTKQEVADTIRPSGRQGAVAVANAAAGQKAFKQAGSGETLQGMTQDLGLGSNWQAIASANGIENPRQLTPGQVIDFGAVQRQR
jgi:hypothetical protein